MVDLPLLCELAQKYLAKGRAEVDQLNPEQMKMIFAKEMEPTTNEYYLARLIDIVSVICHENAEMIKVMKKSFACNDVTGIIRNPQVHPYVRSKYAKLGSVLFMDPVRFRPQAVAAASNSIAIAACQRHRDRIAGHVKADPSSESAGACNRPCRAELR